MTITTTALSPFVGQEVTIVREVAGRRHTWEGVTVLSPFAIRTPSGETGFSDRGILSITPS